MKKVLVILILFLSVYGYGEEKTSIMPTDWYWFDGRVPGPGFWTEFGTNRQDNSYFTTINIHYSFQFWDMEVLPYGQIKTWMVLDTVNTLKGKPFCDIYTAGVEITWQGITFNYHHYCAHDVYSNKRIWETEKYRISGHDGANGDIISVKFRFN